MNIFYLDDQPKQAARWHNDKHVVKMIVESCQLLSTAHRLLDGEKQRIHSPSKNGKLRWKDVYTLPSEKLNSLLYKASHINHPSAKWIRESRPNYKWLADLTLQLCEEYTRRYGRIHKCLSSGLVAELSEYPKNLPKGIWSQPAQAMPDEYKKDDSIEAYREYYRKGKAHLAKWKGKLLEEDEIPPWY